MITETKYAWLNDEPSPKMLVEAVRLFGVTEKAGEANNPAILAWANEAGIHGYNADSIPWCGLFVAICARRAGKSMPESPLWARDWSAWGTRAEHPMLGDVLVFSRNGGGHVGLYVGEDESAYHVLGGNQGDAVSIKRIPKERLIAARHEYKLGAPANVRRLWLSKSGALLSRDEA